MEKLSITIITLNEEKNIRDALESVKWADEIIVVDSGSTDKTLEICTEYTDKVFHQDWLGMNGQKAYAKELATSDWIFNIDADERLSQELTEEIKNILDKGTDCDGFFIPRKVFYLGRWINHSGWYPDYKIRLFKRSKGRWAGNDPHDEVVVDGKVQKLKGDLIHYSFRDISHHIRTLNNYTTIAADEYQRNGKCSGLFEIILRPSFMFFKSYILKKGFRDGYAGFIIAVISSFHVFTKYAKLWELESTEKADK